MIPFPEDDTYPLDKEAWNEPFDITNEECLTSKRLNNYIYLAIVRYRIKNYRDNELWEEFQEGFQGWTTELFAQASREAIKDLREALVRRGVWVKRRTGNTSYAKTLYDTLQEETQHQWTDEERRENGLGTPILSRTTPEGTPFETQRELRQGARFREDVRDYQNTARIQDLNITARTESERRISPQNDDPRLRTQEAGRGPYVSYERFSETPHPMFQDQEIQEQSPGTERKIANLAKLYTDSIKYSGKPYDILDMKLQAFYDLCTKIGLGQRLYHLAFSLMLKDKALDFYYDKITGRSYDFIQMINVTRVHFETEENRQRYLTEWNTLTLPVVVRKNPDKAKLECLEILFDTLRTVQRGLTKEYQTEFALRDQTLNACRDIPECNLAIFKPAVTYEGLCADLRAAVGTAERAQQQNAVFVQDGRSDQFWVDRVYQGNNKRYGDRTQSRLPMRGFNTRTAPGRAGKCYVCHKQGCWSTKHSQDERDKARKTTKEQLISDIVEEEELSAFLASYEGKEPENQDNDSNINELRTAFEAWQAGEMFLTDFGQVDGHGMLSVLGDQAIRHALTSHDEFSASYEPNHEEVFAVNVRYGNDIFHGILPDTGASGISTAGEPQLEALQRILPSIVVDRTKGKDQLIRFGKGHASVQGIVSVETPIGLIQFHIVPTATPFLLCLKDMDTLNVRYDNIRNVLVQGDKQIPIVRKWGHPWMLLHEKEQAIAWCHLTEPELRRLHRRFGHPSVRKLHNMLVRAGHVDANVRTIERIVKFCQYCQLHEKSPGRFKFSLKDDIDFNYRVFIDVFYLDGQPVLQAVDEATSFTAARFLEDMSAKTTWNTLRTCWIDTYLGPPDYLVHDAGTNFASIEFRSNARTIGSEIKEVPVEAHHSIGKVERYHTPLKRAYEIMKKELRNEEVDKQAILQMAVKAVNDTAGPNGLVPTLLVFGAYPRVSYDSAPSQSVILRAKAVRNAMAELRRIHDVRKISNALAMRNGPDTKETFNLPLQSDVRVWRERKGWTGPYKLIAVDQKTCVIDMPTGPTEFRTTSVKPFRSLDQEHEEENEITLDTGIRTEEKEEERTIVVDVPQVSTRTGVRRTRSQPKEIFITKKEEDDFELARTMREDGRITTPGAIFELSRKKEIESLIGRGVFDFVRYDPTLHKGRIFSARLVDEVKGKSTDTPYEKSRLVIQAYQDKGKEDILTQSPTIQRVSQRLIIAIAPSLVREGITISSRDITQAYVQSDTKLNREILARVPKAIQNDYPQDTIMIVRKPLYGIPEAGTHWWATYNKHHKERLDMIPSTYDPCLLISGENMPFGVVGMQTDDTLILGDKVFCTKEEEELQKSGFSAKPVEKLSYGNDLIFNGCILKWRDNQIDLVQKGQGSKIQLVRTKQESLIEDYKRERARGAYLATICQPEAAFDLSVAAQVQNPQEEDIKKLNVRLKWQMEHLDRGLSYIPLQLERTKLFVFVDGSFANNQDLSSQIGYVIILATENATSPYEENVFQIRGNLIHWSSTKSKRVTRSVLASEIYGMVGGVDMAFAIKSTLDMILVRLDIPPIPIVVCTDSFSLYECLVKLGTTTEKRLMIDVMALRQSYERRELAEIRWIHGQDNPSDSMTKKNSNTMLSQFIDNNVITVRMQGWVKRKEKELPEEL